MIKKIVIKPGKLVPESIEIIVSRNENGWTARAPFGHGVVEVDGATTKEAVMSVIDICQEIIDSCREIIEYDNPYY